MSEGKVRISDERLAELREVASRATPGPWLFSPDDGSELDADVVFALDDAGEEVSTVTSWVDANDAAHIAVFDPPTVIQLLDRIAELEAEIVKVRAFINERPGYITALKNTRASEGLDDYYRWAGHAEARRQLAQELGLTVPYEPGETTKRIEGQDV